MKETLKILGAVLAIIIFTTLVVVGFVLLIRKIPKAPILTNEQIIEQTLMCESNGLKARQIYKGGSYNIKQIICQPNNEKESESTTKIKKSNITNVEVNIPK